MQSLRSSTSGGRSLQSSRPAPLPLQPVGAVEAVALLTTCLTLVKPVGMSAEDADAWLTVATGEVLHLPADILDTACTAARRACTHHGQIVPAILKEGEELLALRRKRFVPETIPPERHLPKPAPWHPTPEELAELKAGIGQRVGKRA
jgi:hypothetical protein